MPQDKIIEVPFAFKAKYLQVRHRNPDKVILRDSVSVALLSLTAAEAPVKLTAEMTFHLRLLEGHSRNIELRHDGQSYLRPVSCATTPNNADPTPFTAAQLRGLFSNDDDCFKPFRSDDIPQAWLGPDNRLLMIDPPGNFYARRHDRFLLPTMESVPNVKEWIECPQDEAMVAAIAAAADYVLVDGHLHRRVPAPMLCCTNAPKDRSEADPTKARLIAGEDVAALREKHGLKATWWPIAQWQEFERSTGNTDSFTLKVDAPLQTDFKADMTDIAHYVLPDLKPYIAAALAELSDGVLSTYHQTRTAIDSGIAGEFDACVAAYHGIALMCADTGYQDRTEKIDSLRYFAQPHLTYWQAAMRSQGLDMQPEDRQALAALAS